MVCTFIFIIRLTQTVLTEKLTAFNMLLLCELSYVCVHSHPLSIPHKLLLKF